MSYLGLDWGIKRIGCAFSEGLLARPLSTVTVNGLSDAISKITKIASLHQANTLVIGKPEGEMGKIVTKVVTEFKRNGFDVIEADETLSSKDAMIAMIRQGIGKKARQEDDATAATIILQRYLDDLRARP